MYRKILMRACLTGGYGCFYRNSESCTSLCSRAGVKGGDEQR